MRWSCISFRCRDSKSNKILLWKRIHLKLFTKNIVSKKIPLSPTSGYNHLTADVIENSVIMEDDVHYAPTRIVALENTLNGQIFPIEEITKISRLANHYDMAMHLDGARLWNASAATGISIQDYCKHFNTVSVRKVVGEVEGEMRIYKYFLLNKYFSLLF